MVQSERRYLVLSDLHLADVEDNPDDWKYYKASRFTVDQELAALIASFVEQAAPGAELTLVLNGDTFDFDLVTLDRATDDSGDSKLRSLRATEERSVRKLELILADHPVFLAALADFLAGGHQLVYVLGNHDRELHFDAVRDRFVEALRKSGEARGHDANQWIIRFEPWFYYVPGEIYAEHGQQYDYYTSYRYVLTPLVQLEGQRQIAQPMGNLSNRYLMSEMGYFNPHASDYILNLYSYAAHWLRYYAFSRRSLFFTWFFGSLIVLGRLLRFKEKLRKVPEHNEERMTALAERYGLSDDVMQRLRGLQRPPITQRLYRVIREFWIDRVMIAAVMILGTVVLALVPIALWIKLMVPLTAFPLAYLIYEELARTEGIFTIDNEFPRVAKKIGELLDVPLVVFGHTHVPRLIPMSDRVTFVDSGTWAPITERNRFDSLKPGFRNYLIVTCSEGRQELSFRCWPT